MIAVLITLLILFALVVLVSLIGFAIDSYDKWYTIKERQEIVQEGYEKLLAKPSPIDGLEKCVKIMDKLMSLEVYQDLKPYDKIKIDGVGAIIIDKNLCPKYLYDKMSGDKYIDKELEVALNIVGVKRLIEKCKNLKLSRELEEYRQDKIKNFIKS